jgi:hypothetical protein
MRTRKKQKTKAKRKREVHLILLNFDHICNYLLNFKNSLFSVHLLIFSIHHHLEFNNKSYNGWESKFSKYISLFLYGKNKGKKKL